MQVPFGGKRSGNGVNPYFMWDNTGYVLGVDGKGKPERAAKKFESFEELHQSIGKDSDDKGMRAVLRFLDRWSPERAVDLPYWDDMIDQNLVFRLDGSTEYIHERKPVKELWDNSMANSSSGHRGQCLVTGEQTAIPSTHLDIKGVRGAKSKGAAIVTFNLPAFRSYGKKQNYNAPVGETTAFAYVTALNRLLRYGSRQCVQIGDASTVFWTGRDSPVEGFLGFVFNPGDDKADEQEVRQFLEAVRDGKKPGNIDDLDCPFYMLGLSPNQARISVRFWHVSTVDDISRKIGQHFNDLRLERSFDRDPEFPRMWQLLRQTAHLGKTDNIPPLLSGAFMQSILTGRPYPRSLLSTVIMRIRADGIINYLRAALIKAGLNRHARSTGRKEEISVTLDAKSTNTAYLLGRLFAALEKAQSDALPGINTTIKDRYFGSASATPRVVFPQLIRLAQHHLQKSEYGKYTDKLIEEIVQELQDFPAHLNLEEQGRFALGYYHQRQAFYRKHDKEQEAVQ